MRFGELQEKLAGLVSAAARHARELGGLAALLAQPALASGDLTGIPLPAYAFGLHRDRRDGVLVIAHRELTRRVFLRAGAPVSYDSNAPRDSLLAYLGERGRLSEQQAADVSRSLGEGLRIGAALAEAGVEFEGESLLETLRDYTREKAAEALGMPAGRWAFYEGGSFEQEIATVELPALAVLLACVRRAVPLKHLLQGIKPHLGHFPYRTAGFAQELPSLGLSTTDLKIAMQANGRVRLRELLAHGRGDLREGASLYWMLALSGAIDFREAAGGRGRRDPAAAQAQGAPARHHPGAARGGGAHHHRQLLPRAGAHHRRGSRGGGARLSRDRAPLPPRQLHRVRPLGRGGPAGVGAGEADRFVQGPLQRREAARLPAVPALASGRPPQHRGPGRRGDRAQARRGGPQARRGDDRADRLRAGRGAQSPGAGVLLLPRLGHVADRGPGSCAAGPGRAAGTQEGALPEPPARACAGDPRDHRGRAGRARARAPAAPQGPGAQSRLRRSPRPRCAGWGADRCCRCCVGCGAMRAPISDSWARPGCSWWCSAWPPGSTRG